MACSTTNQCCFSGRGRISLGRYDDCCGIGPDGLDPYPLVFVGNATSLTVNAEVTTQTVPDYTTCAGGNYCEYSEISDPTIQFDLTCSSPDNLAQAWAGNASIVAASSEVVASTIRSFGTLIPFVDAQRRPVQNVNAASVVVTANGVTLVEGLDYEITAHGIYPIEDGPNMPALSTVIVPPATLPAGIPITMQFTHDGYDLVELFTTTGTEVRMFFEGENAANNCAPFTGHLYRLKVQPSSGVPLISQEFATWQVTASILKDNCRTGAGSRYGTFGF